MNFRFKTNKFFSADYFLFVFFNQVREFQPLQTDLMGKPKITDDEMSTIKFIYRSHSYDERAQNCKKRFYCLIERLEEEYTLRLLPI